MIVYEISSLKTPKRYYFWGLKTPKINVFSRQKTPKSARDSTSKNKLCYDYSYHNTFQLAPCCPAHIFLHISGIFSGICFYLCCIRTYLVLREAKLKPQIEPGIFLPQHRIDGRSPANVPSCTQDSSSFLHCGRGRQPSPALKIHERRRREQAFMVLARVRMFDCAGSSRASDYKGITR